MNPLRVSARNYRSFTELDLEIPVGCTAIIGPNGAGKSSIVNVVDLALFGARSLSDYLSDSGPDEEMVIALEFEHRGHEYRVRRTYSGRSRGKSALDFDRYLEYPEHTGDDRGPGWEPLTREDQKATQALIEETIGLSRETFRASAFLAQGDGAAFTEAQPRDRKQILAEVLGLDVWERLSARVKLDIASVDRELTGLTQRIEQAEGELANKRTLMDKREALQADLYHDEGHLADAETAHRTATEALAASRETAAKLSAAREVLASRERELAELVTRRRHVEREIEESAALPKAKAEAEERAGTLNDLEQELTEALAEKDARADHERLLLERNRLLGEASELNERAHALREEAKLLEENGPGATTCAVCNQTLGAEALTATIASHRADADKLDAQVKGKDQVAGEIAVEAAAARLEALGGARAVDRIEADLRVARSAQATLAEIEVRLAHVDTLKATLTELAERHPALESARADAEQEVKLLEADAPSDDLEKNVARAYGTLVEARNACDGTKQRLAVVKAELERLAKVETLAAENRRAVETRQAELDLLKLAERAYGKTGVPVLILENAAIPQIETEANAILAELGTPYNLELLTQKEKKSGDGLKEELYILIDGREYLTYSGGERSRIDIAIRRAIARLLRHRRGVELDLLVIDEPDGLDAAGFAALAESIQRATDDFSKVLVISHHPDLQTAFDQTLTVVKNEGGSRIESGEREAVVV